GHDFAADHLLAAEDAIDDVDTRDDRVAALHERTVAEHRAVEPIVGESGAEAEAPARCREERARARTAVAAARVIFGARLRRVLRLDVVEVLVIVVLGP